MKGTRSQRAWHDQDDFPDLPSPKTSSPKPPSGPKTNLQDSPPAWGSPETPLLAQQDPEELSSNASSHTPTVGEQMEAPTQEETKGTPTEEELLAELVQQAVQLTQATSPQSKNLQHHTD